MRTRTVEMVNEASNRHAIFQAWGDVFIARTDENGSYVSRRICRDFALASQAVDFAIGGHSVVGYRILSESMNGSEAVA
jgi:hypothetical protein